MVLETIDGPGDLRSLDAGQLAILAAEIRELIVASVTGRGDTWAPTWARSSSRWRFTGSSTRPGTSSCGTPATRPTPTRS